MTGSRRHVCFALGVMCVLVIVLAWFYPRRQHLPERIVATAPVTAAPRDTLSQAAQVAVPEEASEPLSEEIAGLIDQKPMAQKIPNVYEVRGGHVGVARRAWG